jgi:mannose-1-phosphate guanylyltransferase
MRERTWVILLTGGGAAPRESQDDLPDDSCVQPAAPERQTLLHMTLTRARAIVPREQIVMVIDRAQRQRSEESRQMLPRENIIVQPRHRGSALEVLLAVLAILERDPGARIIAMPSHHHVSNETALASSLLDAATPTAQTRHYLTLIGIKPDRADIESSYIVPGRWFEDGTRSVLCIAKPSTTALARKLVARGALWDSSIIAARAMVLVGILRVCIPDLVDQMENALAHGDGVDTRQRALAQLHARLPTIDLWQVLARGAEVQCRVITSRCGWPNPAPTQRRVGRPGTRQAAALPPLTTLCTDVV